jgi:UDP:flavonoid glycosyltransferase YjiC (YdhE family)
VKLFITHAGLGSLAEGVYHGVPLITMPGFADQFGNAAKAERKGFGIQINWPDLTEERLR